MPTAQMPLVAVKARAIDLLHGVWMERTSEPSSIQLSDGTNVARANIIGLIVDRSDGELPTLMLDDGSERLPLRVFEKIPGLDKATVGLPVLVIGRPRQFEGERFLVPEVIRILESPAWLELRQKELAHRQSSPPSAALSTQHPAEHAPRQRQHILEAIRANDAGTGADIDEILVKTQCSQEDLEHLLSTGEIFQVSPGRIKVLE